MRRREFIALAGGAAVAWPSATVAQRPAMPEIGFLRNTSPSDAVQVLASLRRGLAERGYTEGQNLAIEYRWGMGRYDQMPLLAAELVQRQVAVIVASGVSAAQAAKSATSTIPIIFSVSEDPIKSGLVNSFSLPDGNATGVAALDNVLGGKRLELLRELTPNAAAIGILVLNNDPNAVPEFNEIQAAARAIGSDVQIVAADSVQELAAAFTASVKGHVDGLLVSVGVALLRRREEVVALAARHHIPTVYGRREYVSVGGLLSYGASLTEAYRQVGVYVGRILKGEKPAELPVQQPTKFELVINLKAAKALGLTVPPSLLARADEIIE